MPSFGKRSSDNLASADERLQKLFNRVIEVIDCAVICGHRDQADQDKAFHAGTSKKQWPQSKHNSLPSRAVDVIPYPVDWNEASRMYYLAGIVKGIASEMGIKIRWGGDWDSDNDFKDQTFHDLPHYEIVEEG